MPANSSIVARHGKLPPRRHEELPPPWIERMKEERITECLSWSDPREQVMKTPDDVAEMLRLRACGWGLKRIARELGCSHHTVKDYVAAGGVKPFKSPERPKRLDGLEGWLRERLIRQRGCGALGP